ncbi:MAG: LamG domain-containing protein [Pedobacter sp.]|uniref:LamG-like jellyroll fold domain-containing protein n=1 Tax=Pedobacter sp. TaxID=1411316 RepID=UPI003568CECE
MPPSKNNGLFRNTLLGVLFVVAVVAFWQFSAPYIPPTNNTTPTPTPTPTFTSTPTPTNTPPVETVKAFWKFNENNGTIATDSSGNGHSGTIINGVYSVGVESSSAISLNGNGYVEIPASGSLSGGNKIKISAWVKPVLGTRGAIISNWYYQYASNTNQRSYVLVIEPNGAVSFALSPDGTSNNAYWLTSSTILQSGVWTLVEAENDGNTMKIKINNVIDPNSRSAPYAIFQSNHNAYIGAWDANGAMGEFYNGLIDELKITG